MNDPKNPFNVQISIDGDIANVSLELPVTFFCSLCENGTLHVHDFFRDTPETEQG